MGGQPLGHGHDHADTSDDGLRASAQGIRAVVVSLVGLAATAGLQVAIVVMSGSVALLADTIHNFTDALTAIPLWIAFRLGRRPPNRRYPYGYHRAEDLAGIFIVLVIAASAGLAAWEAVRRLMDPQELRNMGWVIAAGVAGFAGNELVALYRIRVGRRIGSAALVADGFHARTDGLTSLGVVVGAVGVLLGFERADPIVGLAITVAILFVLASAARSVLRRIMDGTEDSTIGLIEAVSASVPGVEHVSEVRARWAGHGLTTELCIDVDARLTVEQGHGIAEEVRHTLLHDITRLRSASVHVDPHSHDVDPHAPTAHHRSG